MITRRGLLESSMLGASSLALTPSMQQLFAAPTPKTYPTRFIFMTKSNGLRPNELVPVTLSDQQKAIEKNKGALEADLTSQQLPRWMSALDTHKNEMAILQGLSAKGFANGHHSHQACLGMFKMGVDKHLSSIKWATVDVELGRLYPTPFEHIEVQTVGANRGIVAGRASTGPMQFNYAYADPKTAYNELFKTVASSKAARAALNADAMVLQYLNSREFENSRHLYGHEQLKMTNYVQTVEQIRARDRKLSSMSAEISRNVPQLDKKYFSEDATTVERQEAFVEILLSALTAGLTNSVLFSLDTLKTPYNGMPQLEREETISLHDIGHGGSYYGHTAPQLREMIRTHHMGLMNTIAQRLKKTPEGDGTMFDNTVIMYQSENGETHHSDGHQQPVIMLAGKNTKMNFMGNYIRLPGYGEQGHKTLGNWYTTLLNNHGNSIEHYGQMELGLNKYGIDQQGPIKQFLV